MTRREAPSDPAARVRPEQPALRRLLVGCDESDASTSAASFALSLAGMTGASAVLLHTGPTTDEAYLYAEELDVATEQVAAGERAWRQRLEALREYGPPGVSVECRVERGAPAAALVAAAIELEADLVLVGTGGVGRLRGAVLGSVSSPVLQHAPCSVMLFPEREPASAVLVRTVVVGIDGSPSSAYALQVGQALAVALGATLMLAHVVDPKLPVTAHPPKAALGQMRTGGMRILHEARQSVSAAAEDVAEQLLEGRPREELVRASEQHGSAVLVVGTRGLGGFRELLLGSTSRWVVNNARCPVLVAREPAGGG